MRAATKQSVQKTSEKSGDNSGEVTPVPISNTVVKLLSADDTWWEAAWESRTLPVLFCKKHPQGCFFLALNAAASLLSERKVSFDYVCSVAVRKETLKLAGRSLLVIWTLPVFYLVKTSSGMFLLLFCLRQHYCF